MLDSINFHYYLPIKWNFSEIIVSQFQNLIELNVKRIVQPFSSPNLDWCCSSSHPRVGCGCFPPSFSGVVLRDDGSRPTDTMETMETIDTVRRGRWERWRRSSPSDTDWERWKWISHLFFWGCAVFPFSFCWVVLAFAQCGAALHSAFRVVLLLLRPSHILLFMSFRSVYDLIFVSP